VDWCGFCVGWEEEVMREMAHKIPWSAFAADVVKVFVQCVLSVHRMCSLSLECDTRGR
jgi:hypothetical protein